MFKFYLFKGILTVRSLFAHIERCSFFLRIVYWCVSTSSDSIRYKLQLSMMC